MKKLVSVLLTLACVLALATPAFAETEPDFIYDNSLAAEDCAATPDFADSDELIPDAEEDAVMLPDTTENAEETPDSDGEDSILTDIPVAIMYLCVSGPHSHYAFGHTWICIKNISEKAITIGSRKVAPGEMISAGLHHDGGMHYDDEMSHYKGETVMAKAKTLTAKELSKAENEITASRWHWYEYLAHNCTNFATSVWLVTTGQFFLAFCFPFIVQLQMAVSGSEKVKIDRQ